jgi:gliding motility-associated-like protein
MVVPSNINYYVTVTDSLGCFTHTDTASIIYDSTFTPSYDIDKNGICTGDTVSISVLGGTNVIWSPNYNISALTGNGVMAWPDTSMTYVVELTNANLTCKTEMNIPVKVTALRADAGPDYEIFDGEAVILGGPDMLCGEGCKLEWFPDKWLFFNFMQNPKAVPHVTTTYWVMVRNETGNCVDRDSVTVSVKCTDIYMPNAFSPTAQSDDYTRLFGPRNVSLDLEYFRIFNRWGQLVFETRDVGYRWDGKFKGVAQPMDTYVWVIRGKCPNGQLMEKKGNVTLLR